MKEWGFVAGVSNPCVMYHPERGIRAVAHGDDFTVAGKLEDLNWFKERISGRVEVKRKARLGGGEREMEGGEREMGGE